MMQDIAFLFRNGIATLKNIEAAFKAGASPDTRVDGKNTLLMQSCDEYLSSLYTRLCLDYGADINLKNPDGSTALHIFLRSEHATEVVRSESHTTEIDEWWREILTEQFHLLLDHGADIDAQDDKGRTPLMICALLHRGTFFSRELLRRGANPNIQDTAGYIALTIALEPRVYQENYLDFLNTSLVHLLIEHTRHDTDLPSYMLPIITAIATTNISAVRDMLRAGYPCVVPPAFSYLESVIAVIVDDRQRLARTIREGTALQAITERGHTPLMWAAALGRVDMIRALLDAGADVNEREAQEWTPLFFATWQHQVATLHLLLERGAFINHKARFGNTTSSQDPYKLVPVKKNALEFALFLNAQDPQHQSHREICLMLWNTDIDKKEISAGVIEGAAIAEILREYLSQYKKIDPKAAAHAAARIGDVDLVRDIIRWDRSNSGRSRVDKEEPTKLSGDHLLRAVREGDTGTTYYLIATHVDLDTTDYETGKTALILAAERGDELLVRTLVKEGADVYQPSYNGQTAVDYAEANGHTAIAALLWSNIEQK